MKTNIFLVNVPRWHLKNGIEWSKSIAWKIEIFSIKKQRFIRRATNLTSWNNKYSLRRELYDVLGI